MQKIYIYIFLVFLSGCSAIDNGFIERDVTLKTTYSPEQRARIECSYQRLWNNDNTSCKQGDLIQVSITGTTPYFGKNYAFQKATFTIAAGEIKPVSVKLKRKDIPYHLTPTVTFNVAYTSQNVLIIDSGSGRNFLGKEYHFSNVGYPAHLSYLWFQPNGTDYPSFHTSKYSPTNLSHVRMKVKAITNI